MNVGIAMAAGVKTSQAAATLKLLDAGNTVPFVARYRKEATGGLDEVQIRAVAEHAERLRALEARRASIISSVRELGKLSKELESALEQATDLTALEDLYAPHKPKRQTRATRAIDAGLEPVAAALWSDHDVWPLARELRGQGFPTAEAVVAGAQDIIAENVANSPRARRFVRNELRLSGRLVVKKRRGSELHPKFEGYYDFAARTSKISPHQVLAIRRGEREKALSGAILVDDERVIREINNNLNTARRNHKLVQAAIEDGYRRLLKPGVERDVRRELDAKADAHAIDVFALNLTKLLMQAPLLNRRVLAIDPGFRSGCKIAALAADGELLGTSIIFIHDGRAAGAPAKLRQLAQQYQVDVIAVGNGTASHETQEAVAEAIRQTEVKYAVVDEAGASVYSASDVARAEFPDLDLTYRGAISIGRRLQDPLAELVKIDPKSIGVGMYQHDVDQTRLQEAVEAVVVDAVNRVGVELSTASMSLLVYVSGIGPTLAKRILTYQHEHGITTRADLKKIKGIGARAFEQCAGFLRIRDGHEPLDATAIHPESYGGARAILAAANAQVGDPDLRKSLDKLRESGTLRDIAQEARLGSFTLEDLIQDLVRPGRDPRGSVPAPELRVDQIGMDDLREGMRLSGTVRNVVDFGAFIDIGVKQDGLVHISQLGDGFVKDPHQIVSVGDRVEVTVVSIDSRRQRIGLSMRE